MPDEYGPFNSEREALATRAAARIRAAYDAKPGPGASFPAALRVMADACDETGVILGDYEAALLHWLAKWETGSAVSFAGILHRAFEAGKAAGTHGAVTEWGIAYTHRPTIPGVPVRRVIQPYVDEATVRDAVAEIRRALPDDEPALMRHQVTPWEEVPDA